MCGLLDSQSVMQGRTGNPAVIYHSVVGRRLGTFFFVGSKGN